MEPRGFMGGFYRLTEWITRIAGSNLLWLICSLPFMFFMFTWLMADNEALRQQSLLFMAVTAPITLFPATSALFSVVRKWIMGDTDLSTFKVYFKAYKDNYKQSIIGGLLYTLLIVVMIFDYEVYMKQFSNLQFIGLVVLIFLVILFLSLFNFFSLVAHYHLKVSQIFKNAILLTIIRPIRSLTTLLCTVALGYMTMRMPWLIMFGFGSLTALVAFYNFYMAYTKVQEKVEKMREKEDQTEE